MSKRALLVGINHFKEIKDGVEHERPGWQLRGCVNDVVHFEALLKKKPFYFPGDQIRVLKVANEEDFNNEVATDREIVKGLKWLLSDYKDDGSDVRFFHISSHGTQVDDQEDGDEADDEKDEVIVPQFHDWKHPFRDDKLGKLFENVPPNVNFTFVADCCHSGSLARSAPLEPLPPMKLVVDEQGNQTMVMDPPDWRPPDPISYPMGRFLPPQKSRSNLEKTEEAEPKKKWGKYGFKVKDRNVLLAASGSHQTAAESTLPWGGDEVRGAFSWALESAIEEKKGDLTYEELAKRAAVILEWQSQEIQLECPKSFKKMNFLEPLGPGGTKKEPNNQKEPRMSSNLVNFLVALKKREKWRKAAKKAGLSKDAIKTLGSGDATKIEGWLAGEGKATKPIGGESGGS